MSVFTITSSSAGEVLSHGERFGYSDKWVLSVCEFEDGDVHVALSGVHPAAKPGYWCNLSDDQLERVVSAVLGFKNDSTISESDTVSTILGIVAEEPDIVFAEEITA